MAYIDKLLSDIRIEVGDRDESVWTDDELARATDKSVALMSRITPHRDIIETTIVRDIDDETLTIASSTGTLTYKPIKPGSVAMTGKTLDTDFRINYLTGVVTEIGSNLTDDDYTVSYELDDYMLDISSLLPDYIKIERVQYPADDVPVSWLTFDIYGDLLVIRGSAVTLDEDEHLRIVYLKKWTAPTPTAAGDYPSHLDDVVVIGAAGQALIYKAEEYTHLAKDTVAAAVTTLAGISAVTFTSAPDISSYITDADTALDAAITRFAAAVTTLSNLDTPLADANTALDAVATQLGAAETEYLDVGDDLINTGTRGEDVGKTYADYAEVRVDMADTYIEEAKQRIALALANEADAGRDTTIGNSYVNEAIQRLAIAARELDSYGTSAEIDAAKVNYYTAQVQKAYQQAQASAQYLSVAGRFLASGQAKVNEFLTALGSKAEFVSHKASQEQRI